MVSYDRFIFEEWLQCDKCVCGAHFTAVSQMEPRSQNAKFFDQMFLYDSSPSFIFSRLTHIFCLLLISEFKGKELLRRRLDKRRRFSERYPYRI